jgi:uncharacterized LabA/DUF88 family protein
MDRVIAFIDGSNFYFGCKDSGVHAPWDLVSLASELAGKNRTLVRVYYYNARSRPFDKGKEQLKSEEKFYNYLREQDYLTVRLGRLEGSNTGTHQKGVDVLLVQDLLTLTFCDAFDCAILITNDGDFASVIEEIKSRGRQVEVAFPGKSAFHLRDVCDRAVDLLRDFPQHFKKRKR